MPPSLARVLFVLLASLTFVPPCAWVLKTLVDVVLALVGLDLELPFEAALTFVVLGLLLVLLRLGTRGQ